jgi:hypothetical protein
MNKFDPSRLFSHTTSESSGAPVTSPSFSSFLANCSRQRIHPKLPYLVFCPDKPMVLSSLRASIRHNTFVCFSNNSTSQVGSVRYTATGVRALFASASEPILCVLDEFHTCMDYSVLDALVQYKHKNVLFVSLTSNMEATYSMYEFSKWMRLSPASSPRALLELEGNESEILSRLSQVIQSRTFFETVVIDHSPPASSLLGATTLLPSTPIYTPDGSLLHDPYFFPLTSLFQVVTLPNQPIPVFYPRTENKLLHFYHSFKWPALLASIQHTANNATRPIFIVVHSRFSWEDVQRVFSTSSSSSPVIQWGAFTTILFTNQTQRTWQQQPDELHLLEPMESLAQFQNLAVPYRSLHCYVCCVSPTAPLAQQQECADLYQWRGLAKQCRWLQTVHNLVQTSAVFRSGSMTRSHTLFLSRPPRQTREEVTETTIPSVWWNQMAAQYPSLWISATTLYSRSLETFPHSTYRSFWQQCVHLSRVHETASAHELVAQGGRWTTREKHECFLEPWVWKPCIEWNTPAAAATAVVTTRAVSSRRHHGSVKKQTPLVLAQQLDGWVQLCEAKGWIQSPSEKRFLWQCMAKEKTATMTLASKLVFLRDHYALFFEEKEDDGAEFITCVHNGHRLLVNIATDHAALVSTCSPVTAATTGTTITVSFCESTHSFYIQDEALNTMHPNRLVYWQKYLGTATQPPAEEPESLLYCRRMCLLVALSRNSASVFLSSTRMT